MLKVIKLRALYKLLTKQNAYIKQETASFYNRETAKNSTREGKKKKGVEEERQ